MEKFDFSHAEYERFIEICDFSEEEKKVLSMRRCGKSVVEMSMALSLSPRTIDRRVKDIKRKIKREL